jgi:hypothetical protein
MAQQFSSLIKFRRGLKEQRLKTSFQEGEPVYETDTKRLFIGVGDNNEASVGPETVGGIITSNLTFIGPASSDPSPDTEPRSYSGDLMYANNKLWRMGDSNWEDISPKVDGITLAYNANNELQVLSGAFSVTAGNGISITSGNTVNIKNSPQNILQIVNGELTIPQGSITADYFSTETFSSDYFTIIGSLIQINLDPNYFSTTGNIKITKVPAGEKNDTLTTVDNKQVGTVNAVITNRLGESSGGITLDSNLNLQIDPQVTVINDETNQITGLKPGIGDVLAVNDSTSKAYNGSISDYFDEDIKWTGHERTEISLFEEDRLNAPNPMTVFSGGMILMDMGTTKTGKGYKRYAVPVFELPEPPEIYHIELGSDNTPGSIIGDNLGGIRVWTIESNTNPVENIVAGSSINLLHGTNRLELTSPISIPPDGQVIAKNYIGTLNLADYTANNPIIRQVTYEGSGTPVTSISIDIFNVNSTKANFTKVEYALVSAPETNINIPTFDVQENSEYLGINSFVNVSTWPSRAPNWEDISSVTVTYSGTVIKYTIH